MDFPPLVDWLPTHAPEKLLNGHFNHQDWNNTFTRDQFLECPKFVEVDNILNQLPLDEKVIITSEFAVIAYLVYLVSYIYLLPFDCPF